MWLGDYGPNNNNNNNNLFSFCESRTAMRGKVNGKVGEDGDEMYKLLRVVGKMRCSESLCQESEVQYDSVIVREWYSDASRIIQLRKKTVLI